MKRFLIIGFGNIGYRHFQGIYNKNNEYVIIDKVFSNNLKHISKNYKNVFMYKQISQNLKKFDLCIVSTNSKERYKILNQIISFNLAKNIILEKILFSNLLDYSKAKKIKKKKIWVNCLNRNYPVYKKFLKKNKNKNFTKIEVIGSNWGMFCNFIHYIDLMYSFNNNTNYVVKKFEVSRPFPSKRAGYNEFYGEVILEFENGSQIFFSCKRKKNIDLKVGIYLGSKLKLLVDEINGTAIFYANNNKLKKKIYIPYLSQFSKDNVKKIFKGNLPELIDFKNAIKLHEPMIKSLSNHLSNISKKKVNEVNIT